MSRSPGTEGRASTVAPRVISLERMMAETRPVPRVDAAADLVDAVLAEPACELVVDPQDVTPSS